MGTLVVFHKEDGQDWAHYLGACLHERPLLSNHQIDYKAHDSMKKDAVKTSHDEKEVREVLIFVVTPSLSIFMEEENTSGSFEHIVKSPSDTVLVFCSVSERDIALQKQWFPSYESLQKLVLTGSDENVLSVLEQLAKFILHPKTQLAEKPPIRPRVSHSVQTPSRGSSPASNANSRTSSPTRSRTSRKEQSDRQTDFRIFPCRCRCDEKTDVVIVFKHRIAKSDFIEVELKDGPKETTSLHVVRHNPCTFQFTFKSNRSGIHELSVKKNNLLLGTRMFEVYGSPADPLEIQGVSLIYLALMDSICKCYQRILSSDSGSQANLHASVSRQCSTASSSSSSSSLSSTNTGTLGRAHSSLDYELSHVLRDHTYIPDSFNLFSGCLPGGSSSQEIPTLLHFAAHYGLQEMVAALIDHNNARIACSVHNHAGATPIDVARHAGHEHIASLLDEFIKTSLQGESIYMAMEQYYYSQGDEDDPNENSEQDAYSVCSGAAGKVHDDHHSNTSLHRDDSIYDEVKAQEEEDPYKELDDVKGDITRNSGSTLVASSGSSSATTINSQQSSPTGHADGAVECYENLDDNVAASELLLGGTGHHAGSTSNQVYLQMGLAGESSTDDPDIKAELESYNTSASVRPQEAASAFGQQDVGEDTYAIADDFKSGKKTPEPFKEEELFNYTTTKEISDLRTNRLRAERKDSVGSMGSMGSEEGAAPLTTFVQCPSQQELMDIMNMVKRKEITMDHAEEMFQQWQEQHQATRSASFKEKQEQLKKLQEEYNRVQKNIASQRKHSLKDIFTRRISAHKKESKKKPSNPIPFTLPSASPRLARQSEYDSASELGTPSQHNIEVLERRPLPPVPTEMSSTPVTGSKIMLQDSKRFSTVSTSSSTSNSSCGSAASAASAASCQDSGVESTNYDEASGGGDKESGDEHLHVMTTPDRYVRHTQYESLENSEKRTEAQEYDIARRPLPKIPDGESTLSQDALEGRPALPRRKTHFTHRPLPPLPKEDEGSPSSSPSRRNTTPPRKPIPSPKAPKPALPKKPLVHSQSGPSPKHRANYCNVVFGIENSPLFQRQKESGQGSDKLSEAPPAMPPR